MSAAADRERAHEWLEEQLAGLEKLRNASPRDPSFKLWRQNTLTVLQRIWPAEPGRSELFRRIAFSPSTTKPAGGIAREWFARGCAETTEYLHGLLHEVSMVGTPEASAEPGPAPFVGDGSEGSVPMLDLSTDASAPAGGAPAYAMEDNVLDLGGPKGPARRAGDDTPPQGIPRLPEMLRAPGTTPEFEAAADAAPSLPRGYSPLDEPSADAASAPPPVLRAPTEPVPPIAAAAPVASAPVAPAPPAAAAPPVVAALPIVAHEPVTPNPPAPAPDAAKPPVPAAPATRARKAAPGDKLKNMLGFGDFDAVGEPEPPAAAVPPPPPAPAEASPVRKAVSPTPSRRRTDPGSASSSTPAPHPSATPSRRKTDKPPALKPAPASASRMMPVPPAPVTPPAAATPSPSRAMPVPPALVTPPAAAPPPAPADGHSEPYDPATLTQATEDFLRNSPILGLQGRPVQRTTDVTQYQEPDAVAIATFASELGRLGVPEAARPDLQVSLDELAAQMDRGQPEWERLRAALTAALAHPELARRIFPVLLPWLDRAA